jgi:anti-sigma regulatory factor (Ser/Thr protein kinase)
MVAPHPSLRYDRLDYTPFPQSVTLARRRTQRLVGEWGHPELAADTGLLVSELGGNAVLHGALRDRLFRVELTLDGDVLRVSVSDPKGESLPSPRVPGDGDMFGRGLVIVGEVADRWGVSPLTVGKAVWCELDVVSGAGPTDCLVGDAIPPSRRTDMAEPPKAFVGGVEVDVSHRIPDIRAALLEERRGESDAAVDGAEGCGAA